MTTPIQPQTQTQVQAQPQTQTIPTPSPTPQIIQVQIPPQAPQPLNYVPAVQGDIGTFLVLIALTLLVKLLTDKPAGG